VADAAEVARVMSGVAAEREFSAADEPMSAEQAADWIRSGGERGTMLLAEADGRVVGFQTFEPFNPYVRSMRHVGVAGTQVERGARGAGVGRALWDATVRFAVGAGYEKAIVYVRRRNERALRFYRSLGFRDVGVSARHVRIDGAYDDERFLECFLPPTEARPR
jgi:phosphinothricin acetyltransferase